MTINDGFDPKRKGHIVCSIVFVILAFVTYVTYLILSRKFPELLTVNPWIMIGASIAFLVISACFIEYAKKKKYGSRRLVRIVDTVTWIGLIIVVFAGVFLR